ncbi:Protein of unknown function DUF1350 [Trichormus variabilis ATCC 29413]|uniref:DUF1350 domain-containing protein n=2 Tax=Anabaena variabilis TaxID=264691 RepID=Q3MBC3_TRIV2|nr:MULTISPECIES: DUF1350 family protein [Nostocaceae]ABA21713.1 Protein of unknown function DUF1350 [Trichormus variabilis ATCC 29413]MBC1213062.1 DUF1350 family protein [Trichormus variabilis ARAD]MBC1258288.1 DUF1350 family protein [Trichormus variabilis V5]MBC1266535.1 DUF1350 family protein [Trichormus variabilis FSR]MBC1303159.1 DUF1350 family protein [Trichormus variabilis N2B]
MKAKLRFQPVSHSWVALHPKPKGVIQFIGGAFFGTFVPMLFYRYLLQYLFDNGYTIILLPFNFTFNHYAEAGFLIREEYEIAPELIRMAKLANYDYQVYLNDRKFSWIGHSIGCKYIALLEAFSALPRERKELEEFIGDIVAKTSNPSEQAKNERKIQAIVENLEVLMNDLKQQRAKATQLIKYYLGYEPDTYWDRMEDPSIDRTFFKSLFIKGQTSILLAPVNTGTDSAVPKFLANIIDKLGWGVKPSPQETYALIQATNLFNLLGLIRFKSDNIAKSTGDWFINVFKKPPTDFQNYLAGGHLKPLGIRVGGYVVNFPDSLPIIESAQRRSSELEIYVDSLLQALEKERRL